MTHFLEAFWLCFVPFFVAVDPVGMAPLFIALTGGLPKERCRRIILQSVITALLVALIFLAIGEGIMRLLGISVPDFMIAGGVLLFIIAISDITRIADRNSENTILDPDSLGAVPLGVPLITGPAVLATSVLMMQQHGAGPTAAAIVATIGLVALVLSQADRIVRMLGKAGSKAFSKIFALLLAAIAVMIIRRGIAMYLKDGIGS